MAIHDCENLHAFATAGVPDFVSAALGRGKRRIDEALALVDLTFLAQRISQLCQNLAQHLAFAPLLEPAMHRLVVGVALRPQVPLRAGVENPEHGLQDRSRRNRLAACAALWDVFLGKVLENPFPVVVAQPHHARTYT